MAAAGPAAVAVAHFLQSMVLLRLLPAQSFGAFTFLLAIAAFSWSLWNAVFCTPLPYLIRSAPDEAAVEERERIISSTVLAGAALATGIFFLIAMMVGLDPPAALLFSAFASLALIRWFGRASAYLHGRQVRAFASDLIYSIALVATVSVLWATDRISLANAYAAMSAAALLAMVPFGFEFARRLTARLWHHPFRQYVQIARKQAPWSVLGVVSTELTSNSHVYVVTLVAGTQAYAPIAATALLVRPMSVASSALRDLERPRFARLIGAGKIEAVLRGIRWMRGAMILVWIATAALVITLFWYDPRLLFPRIYDVNVLITGAALWLLVSGLAMWRVPESALLQAVGTFRQAALASVNAAVISVASVTLLLILAGPVWSIAGIFIGQIVHAVQINALARDWRRQNDPAAADLA